MKYRTPPFAIVKEEMKINHRVHSMIIGTGISIGKIMSDFNVDIKLGDPDQNLVVVIGSDEDNVSSCIKHLASLSEDFLNDDAELMNPSKESEQHKSHKKAEPKGFQVTKGAPWQGASDEAFPTLGGPAPAAAGSSASTPVWGTRR